MPYDLPNWISSKIIPEPNSGCWLWTASLVKGYGQIKLGRSRSGKSRNYPAHRLVYEFYFGPVADALVLDHRCRIRSCVNPNHLETVTNRINILRGTGPSAYNATKLICDNGHSLDDAYVGSWGRKCRVCQLENVARYYRRKKQ